MQENWPALLKTDLERLFGFEEPGEASTAPELEDGERRQVAALFLDIRGFTELSQRLDHESVHMLTGAIMRALARVVERHQGYVDKFEGDRIMALFGARLSTENDCVRAVSCGLTMLDALEEINAALAPRQIEVGARIGIAAGSATVAPDPSGHLTATGSVVNLASRLEGAASVDTVLVSESTRRACGSHFRWQSVGPLALKGISGPQPAFTPVGPGEAQVRRWERAEALRRSPMVGRESEMRWLREVWERQASSTAKNRRGGAVHLFAGVRGEAGIGKSRLLHEFLGNRCPTDNCLLLSGHALPFAQPAMTMWTTMLRDLFGMRPGDLDAPGKLEERVRKLSDAAGCRDLADALLRSSPFLARLLDLPANCGTVEDMEEEEKIFEEQLLALRNLLRVLAGLHRRVVLKLEDLHWLDPASRRGLDFVLANCDTETPLLLLATYRPYGEGPPTGGHSSGGYREFGEIRLGELGVDSCRSLVRHMAAGREVTDEALEFLIDRARGNPFYLEELFLESVESGLLEIGEDHLRVAADPTGLRTPPSVSGLVRSRMDRLSKPARRGLQLASVLGVSFTESLFSTVHDMLSPQTSAEEVLGRLERRKMLTRSRGTTPVCTFVHALTRDAAYDTLLIYNRCILHRCAALGMQRVYGDDPDSIAAAVAHHYEQAKEMERAAEWANRALSLAMKGNRLGDVLEWSGRLMAWQKDRELGPEKAENLLEVMGCRAQALDRLGRRKQQEEFLEELLARARELGHSRWVAGAHNKLGALYRKTGRIEQALAEHREALRITEESGEAGAAIGPLNSLGAVYTSLNRTGEAMECYRRALEMARTSEGSRNEAYVLANLGILYRRMGRLDESAECHEKAMVRFAEQGNRRDVGASVSSLGILYFMRGEVKRAGRAFERALEVAREVGDRWFECTALANMGMFRGKSGGEGAEKPLLAALDIAVELGDRDRERGILSSMAQLYMGRQRHDEALECYRRALAIVAERGNESAEAEILQSMGSIQLRTGDRESAGRTLVRAVEKARVVGEDMTTLEALADLALLRLHEGETAEALGLYREADEVASRAGHPGGAGSDRLSELRKALMDEGLGAKDADERD